LVLGLAICVICACAFVFVRHHRRRDEARMAVAVAYHDLQVCLYGAPLPDAELGNGALRRAAAKFCRDPRREARAPGCKGELAALQEAWSELPDEQGADEPARSKVNEAFAPVTTPEGRIQEGVVAERWWDALIEAMRRFRLPEVAGASSAALHCVDVRPELIRDSTSTLVMADIRPTRRGVDGGSLRELVPFAAAQEDSRGGDLRLLSRTRQDDVACWFAASGPPEARCGTRQLDPFGTHQLDPYRSIVECSDAVRGVFALQSSLPFGRRGAREMEVIVDVASGATRGDIDARIWVRAGGAATFAKPKGEALVHLSSDGARSETALPVDESGWWYRLFPGWALRTATARGRGNHRNPPVEVAAMPLDQAGRAAGPLQHLGIVDGHSRPLACRRADGVTTLIWVGSDRRAEIAVAYPRSATELAPFVMSHIDVARDEIGLGDRWADGLGCTERGDPRWAFVADGVLHEVSCTPAGCEHDDTRHDDRRFTPDTVVAIGNDEILEAGRHSLTFPEGAEPRSILGMRRAKLHDLDTAPLRVLLAEPEKGRVGVAGAAAGPREIGEQFERWSWLGLRPYSRGDVGWVVGSLGGELVAIRLRPGQPAEIVRRVDR
jgi:hypothetical protein